MILSLLFLAGLSSMTWAQSNDKQALVFPIISTNLQGKKAIHCSATMMKLGDRCQLFTAAHCLSETGGINERKIVLKNWQRPPHLASSEADKLITVLEDYLGYMPVDVAQYFPSYTQESEQSLSVLKVNEEKDLALLKIPPALQGLCPQIAVAQEPRPHPFKRPAGEASEAMTLVALGELQSGPQANYSKNYYWHRGYGNSYMTLLSRQHADLPQLAEIQHLLVTPGMSGGVVMHLYGFPLGLIKGFRPFQNVSVIITLQELIKFTADSSTDEQKKEVALLENDHHIFKGAFYSAQNTTAQASNNVHADGGENVHADGGSHPDRRFSGLDLLASFLEPDEGIPCPFDPQKMLVMGVYHDGIAYQVDGKDDFLNQVHGKSSAQTLVHRAVQGYPRQEVRNHILQRLKGKYQSWGGPQNMHPSHALFKENSRLPERWMRVRHGELIVSLEITEDWVELIFWSHSTAQEGSWKSDQSPEQKIRLKAELENEGKMLVLENAGLRFVCENKHFLKIICRDVANQTDLSFSIDHTDETRSLQFRLAQLKHANGGRWVNYYYGKLMYDE